MATRSEVVCGIDLGSTNIKVVGLDRTGRVVGRLSAATPRGADGLLVPAELLATVEEMLLRLGAAGHVVLAGCAAGVGEDGLLVGARQEPLCDVLPWYHPARGALLVEVLGCIDDVPGLPVATEPACSLVGWLWARRHAGADRAASWVALTDWVGALWSGRAFMSDTLAARTAAWTPEGGGWVPDRVLPTLGDGDLLPPVLRAGEVVGRLSSDSLKRAGVLAPDAVVVAGGHDHPVGAWAVRHLSPKALVDSMGTAEVVVTQSPRSSVARSSTYDVGPGIGGTGTTVLAVQQLARNVEWASRDAHVGHAIRRLLSGDARPTDDVLGDAFVPGWRGESAPSFAAGAPAHPLARASAVLGGLARHGEARIRDVGRTLCAEPEVFATGGWSRSAGWMAIKEQVSHRAFRRIAEPEVTAVAAALLAAGAVGWDVAPQRVLELPGVGKSGPASGASAC